MWRQRRKFEIVILGARRREYFRGVWAIFLFAGVPSKEVIEYTGIHSLLVNGLIHANLVDTSLVIVIFMLHVLTYVVSYKLFRIEPN